MSCDGQSDRLPIGENRGVNSSRWVHTYRTPATSATIRTTSAKGNTTVTMAGASYRSSSQKPIPIITQKLEKMPPAMSSNPRFRSSHWRWYSGATLGDEMVGVAAVGPGEVVLSAVDAGLC